jgi:hypothetical protein
MWWILDAPIYRLNYLKTMRSFVVKIIEDVAGGSRRGKIGRHARVAIGGCSETPIISCTKETYGWGLEFRSTAPIVKLSNGVEARLSKVGGQSVVSGRFVTIIDIVYIG